METSEIISLLFGIVSGAIILAALIVKVMIREKVKKNE